LLVATRVDPTRVGGGQLSLPGVSWYKPTYDVMGPPTTVLYTKYVRKVNNYFPPGPKN
jgi:hypothetical protein